MQEDKFAVEAALREEAKKKRQEAKSSPRQVKSIVGTEQLRSSLYQNVIDYIGATPDFSLCIRNPESCELIPSLKSLIGKDESIDRKLSEIFSNNQSTAYKNFIIRVKETMQTKDMVLENILKREAVKSGREQAKFKIIDLSPSTWKWLSFYYNSNKQVKDFVIKYREDYAKSLADLINEAYLKVLRSPETFN